MGKDIVPELEKEEAKLDAEGADEAEEEECCEPDERFQNLDRISTYLRDREDLPVDATYPSECIRHPTSGDDAGLTAENCVHVDSSCTMLMMRKCWWRKVYFQGLIVWTVAHGTLRTSRTSPTLVPRSVFNIYLM